MTTQSGVVTINVTNLPCDTYASATGSVALTGLPSSINLTLDTRMVSGVSVTAYFFDTPFTAAVTSTVQFITTGGLALGNAGVEVFTVNPILPDESGCDVAAVPNFTNSQNDAYQPLTVESDCNFSQLFAQSELLGQNLILHSGAGLSFNLDHASYLIDAWYTVTAAPTGDLGDSGLVAGPAPTCSVGGDALPSSGAGAKPRITLRNPNPVDVVEAQQLQAIAGSTKPGTGIAHLVCVGTCNGAIDFSLTAKQLSGGIGGGIVPNWLSITAPNGTIVGDALQGTVVGTTPFELDFSGDASQLSAAGSPYTGQFTVTGSFKSSPIVRDVIFDVLPSCSPLKFVSGSIAPDPARGVDPTEPVIATVTYDFTSLAASQAQLALRLYDSADPNTRVLQGSSDFIAVTKSDMPPSKSLVINPAAITIPKTLATVYLVASLIDSVQSTVLAETTPVMMPVVPGLSPSVDVIQVTQDSLDTVPMISGKQTLIRVYPRQFYAQSNLVQGVDATISAVLVKPGGSTTPLSAAGGSINGPITALITPNQGQLNASLNFIAPPDWISNAGKNVQITAVLKPPATRPDNPKYNTSSPQETGFVVKTWSQSQPYKIGYFPLCWIARTNRGCPTAAISNPGPQLSTLYPFATRDSFQYYEIPFPHPLPPWPDDLSDSNPLLEAALHQKLIRYIDGFIPGLKDPPNKIVAWFTILALLEGLKGSSDAPWATPGKGRAAWAADQRDPVESGRTLAHEIGHDLGLHHATAMPAMNSGCSQAEDTSADPDWLYLDNTIQSPGLSWLAGPAIVPATEFDLMAYCPGATTFISPFHYKQLVSGLTSEWYASGLVANAIGSHETSTLDTHAATPSDFLVITGSATQNGSAGQLDPPYHVTSTDAGDTSDPNGNYCIRFSGASGTLSDFCFTPSFSNGESEPMSQVYFDWMIPYVAGTTGISLILKTNGATLASAVSAGPPSIAIQSPKPADTLAGQQTIAWTASDPAAAPLTYLVQSSNDGSSWYPMSYDLTGTQFQYDAALFQNAPVYLRVIAMNGVDSASATVGPLTVNVNPQLSLVAGPIDFGNVTIGVGGTQSIPITNSGTGQLPITSVTSDNPVFIPPSGTFYVAPDLPASVPIDFQPTAIGPQQGNITVNGSATIAVKGYAFSMPVPSAAVSATTLNFGTVASGQTATMTLTISNTGGAALTVDSISSSNALFTLSGVTAPFTIAAGAQQQLTVQFAPTAVGSQQGSISISSNDPTPSHATLVVATQGIGGQVVSMTGPQIGAGGVVSAANGVALVSRGALASIYGINFSTSAPILQGSLPLPIQLGGVSVTVDGIPAPIDYVQSNQINFQVPYEVPAGGLAPVVVTSGGTLSNIVSVAVADYALGVFEYARTSTVLDPIVVHSNYALVSPANPAMPGESLIIFATGIGKLNNPPATGAAALASPLATAVDTPTITVGGSLAIVQFAGLSPG
ncbi:MAG: choice-of-anchor D domain-containing protein, partial [Bryobacteraceae bacterium]